MKHVMWKGELQGKISLDTIKNKTGLYGLGPAEYLRGELLVVDGKTYLSQVLSDSSMLVKKNDQAKAPFFVYGRVNHWTTEPLSKSIKTISDLEHILDEKAKSLSQPFIFKLKGTVDKATIHIQNLPKGSKVSSPKEAHAGQTNYELTQEHVEIIGFYSTKHQGVFTHHDTHLHTHLITTDQSKMGHLDTVSFGDDMVLFLPK